MKDILLKIIQINIPDCIIEVNNKERAKRTASEIAELVEQYNMWKDRKLTLNLMGYDDIQDTYIWGQKAWSPDKLFTYWYNEIKTKQKEQQRDKIIELMQEDEGAGLYEPPDEEQLNDEKADYRDVDYEDWLLERMADEDNRQREQQQEEQSTNQ